MYLHQTVLLAFVACVCQAHAKYIRHYLNLTWALGSPNGHQREMILVNGQMPGPELRWDEGDDIEVVIRQAQTRYIADQNKVVVQNDLPFNSSVHWHGLLMQDTPWSDGVPGFTQKPIEPGQSFIYRFKAEPGGTYWYHAHARMTLLDGLYGPIFIRPKPDAPLPVSAISTDQCEQERMVRATRDPILVTLSDWSNVTSWEYFDIFEQTKAASFCTDSILVNGKGSQYCPGKAYLNANMLPFMAATIAPQHVSDKGCLPINSNTQDYFLPYVNVSAFPPHYLSGCLPASQPNTTIEVDPRGGWASLNFVMASMNKWIVVSIDEHEMWVYEVDGQYIEPQRVNALTIYSGQRYSVLVKLDKEPKDYVIHVPDAGIAQVQPGYAILSYKGGKGWLGETQPYVTWNGSAVGPEIVWLNDSYMPPFPPNPPAQKPANQTIILKLGRSGQPYLYSMSPTGFSLWQPDDFAYSPLLYDSPGHIGDGVNDDLTIKTLNGSYVDIVLYSGWRLDDLLENHVLHKHANKVWIIGSGLGVWNWSTVDEAMAVHPESFNLENPVYRDSFVTSYLGTGWMVVRYQVTNPGAWFFHCHFEIHLQGGMGVAILDGVNAWPTIPPEYGVWQMGHPVMGNRTYAPEIEELNNTKYESPSWDPLFNGTFNDNVQTVA